MDQIVHPYSEAPATAQVIEIAEGVLWLRMPLPFTLDHINLWALADGDGWAIVDTGVGNDATKQVWETLLAGPLGGKPVTRLICTHHHPDHMGLAGWFTERWDAPLVMTFGEWCIGRMLWLDYGADYLANQMAHYRRVGYGADMLEGVAARGNTYRPNILPPPASFVRILEGDVLEIGGRSWRVFTYGGHTPEQACLWCEQDGLFIAGDQILPKISPVVGVWGREPEAEPLSAFLASLKEMKKLGDDALVLPAHGLPFRGLAYRCAELEEHHQRRLDRTWEALTEPLTPLDALGLIFRRPLDSFQRAFAIGETLAHLHLLVRQGKVSRVTDAEGRWLYRRI